MSRLPNEIDIKTKKPVKKRHLLKLFLRKDVNTLGSISSSAIAYIMTVEDFIDYNAAPMLESMIPINTTHLCGHAISADKMYCVFSNAVLVPQADKSIMNTKYKTVVLR